MSDSITRLLQVRRSTRLQKSSKLSKGLSLRSRKILSMAWVPTFLIAARPNLITPCTAACSAVLFMDSLSLGTCNSLSASGSAAVMDASVPLFSRNILPSDDSAKRGVNKILLSLTSGGSTVIPIRRHSMMYSATLRWLPITAVSIDAIK